MSLPLKRLKHLKKYFDVTDEDLLVDIYDKGKRIEEGIKITDIFN